MMKKTVCIFMALIFALCFAACSNPDDSTGSTGNGGGNGGNGGITDTENDYKYDEPGYDDFTVSARETVYRLESTDALGRYFGSVQSLDRTKKVGLFYFLWMGQHDQASAGANGCAWDSSLLTESELKSNNGEAGVFHYWNKPLYDYYNSEDPWVFRKHLELFCMAGIDYLVFDVSNSYYYKKVCDSIFPVALECAAQGWDIPKFIFYCYNKTKDTVTGIYDSFYDSDNAQLRKYDCLWYCEEDNGERNLERKPWIFVKNNGVGTGSDGSAQNYSECDEKIKDRFYTRELRWNQENAAAGAEWLFPSDIDNPVVHKGMYSVSVAQHTSGAFSDSVFEAGRRDSNRGRGWDGQLNTNVASNVYLGTNYQGEWERAFSLGEQVNNIFLSTWNEWVAQKQPYGANGRSSSYFVDQFNPEFSRDLEMTAGLWGDNYYLQTVNLTRMFKGVTGGEKFLPRQAKIDIKGNGEQWHDTVGYLDFKGDTTPRNYKSSNLITHGNVPVTVYKDNTGRNDIVQTNVTCDSRNLYFRIECASDITEYQSDDECWMNILIEIDGVRGSNWENYQFVVNRYVDGNKTTVERLKSNGDSEEIGVGSLHRDGKYLTVAIPRKLVELDGKEHFTMNFKVADNVTNYKDIMDYYVNGDSAPIGRLNYTFEV